MKSKHEWVIIKLANRNETPIETEIVDGIEYYVDDDWEDGIIFDGYKTKKEAEEQAKIWRWCERFEANINNRKIKYRYIVEREDRI